MRSHTTSAMIVMRDELNIEYRICRLDYTIYEDDSFEYVFTPDYSMIEILPKEFQGIPGIDLDLHRERYVRRNIEPVFVTERSPSRNRQDLWQLLDEAGMEYLNRLEWMIRTGKGYVGDSFFVIRYEGTPSPIIINGVRMESSRMCYEILSAIGAGRSVVVDGREFSGEERKTVCSLLRSVLSADRKYKASKRSESDVRLGRRPISVSRVDLERVRGFLDAGIMTMDEAAHELGISRVTLYRRLKEQR